MPIFRYILQCYYVSLASSTYTLPPLLKDCKENNFYHHHCMYSVLNSLSISVLQIQQSGIWRYFVCYWRLIQECYFFLLILFSYYKAIVAFQGHFRSKLACNSIRTHSTDNILIFGMKTCQTVIFYPIIELPIGLYSFTFGVRGKHLWTFTTCLRHG